MAQLGWTVPPVRPFPSPFPPLLPVAHSNLNHRRHTMPHRIGQDLHLRVPDRWQRALRDLLAPVRLFFFLPSPSPSTLTSFVFCRNAAPTVLATTSTVSRAPSSSIRLPTRSFVVSTSTKTRCVVLVFLSSLLRLILPFLDRSSCSTTGASLLSLMFLLSSLFLSSIVP
jgi:hypothetical protein